MPAPPSLPPHTPRRRTAGLPLPLRLATTYYLSRFTRGTTRTTPTVRALLRFTRDAAQTTQPSHCRARADCDGISPAGIGWQTPRADRTGYHLTFLTSMYPAASISPPSFHLSPPPSPAPHGIFPTACQRIYGGVPTYLFLTAVLSLILLRAAPHRTLVTHPLVRSRRAPPACNAPLPTTRCTRGLATHFTAPAARDFARPPIPPHPLPHP